MNLGRLISRSIVREMNRAGRSYAKVSRRKDNFNRLQAEAAYRQGSELVHTPRGAFWMSPIEAKLYRAMVEDGLDPWPQYCVEGYFVDFAFPDVLVAVEADGAAYHGEAQTGVV